MSGREHSPPRSPSSNGAPLASWEALGRACREALVRGGRSLGPVLRAAAEATRSERAFLVSRGADGVPRVDASITLRSDREERTSATVLRRAFEPPLPVLCPDASADRRLGAGASVRSLEIRRVLAVPVTLPTSERIALVLDSRAPGAAPRDLAGVLEAFGSLLGLVCAGRPRSQGDAARPARPMLVGRAPAFLDLLRRVRRVAPFRFPVLVLGESGSGKEGVARTLHLESPRRLAPFLAVNCAAVPETLLESELFGVVRGAYTGAESDRPGLFQLADGGTLLLDEVGDMPQAMRAKVLRALQEGRVRPVGGREEIAVDVRIVASTHRHLASLVEEGRFRADLYYRLAVVPLRVPPLRERLEDLPLLSEHLIARLAEETGGGGVRLEPQALAKLASHDWPGNVRELEAVLARAVLRCEGGRISSADLELPASAPAGRRIALAPPMELTMIQAALLEAGGNLTRAAASIGWTKQKLYRRMAALGAGRSTGIPGRRGRPGSA